MKETDLGYMCLDWWRVNSHVGFPDGAHGKESTCQCRRCKRHGFDPWVGKIPWSKKWQPTPVFLPGKFHWQRSLAGYCLRRHKELDMTARLNTHPHSCVAVWSATGCEVSGVTWGSWARPVCWVLLGIPLSWGCVFPLDTGRTPHSRRVLWPVKREKGKELEEWD